MSDCSNSCNTMKVLNIAGNNKAAETIAHCLSGGSRISERYGSSQLRNKIYDFETQFEGCQRKMIMTALRGHLLTHEFTRGYNWWSDRKEDLIPLFEVPVEKVCKGTSMKILETLETEVMKCDALIIWTNCDREGENMGYEAMQLCQEFNPNLKIYRARFSAITPKSVRQALDDLGTPDKAVSDAIEVRREMDFRTGRAFTRFQTGRLRNLFPEAYGRAPPVSYGSCQFPTLFFVVERHRAIEAFQPNPSETIEVMDVHDGIKVEFRWEKIILIGGVHCQEILNKCLEAENATVQDVVCRYDNKEIPLPLNTVDLIKHCSEVLNFTPKKSMDLAQDLYNRGVISYPRTDTNIFPDDLDVFRLVENHCANKKWGSFALKVLHDKPSPQRGTKSDGAHPPIYPTKTTTGLSGDEAKLYEFIVRRFLACVSKDAEVKETTVKLRIADEIFEASGIRITAKNYLEVYPWKNWNERRIHDYKVEQKFKPFSIAIMESKTAPPELLTKSDLISILAQNHIGTNSTYADHIDKIQSAGYVSLTEEKRLLPTPLGLGLLDGYRSMGVNIVEPDHRGELESKIRQICHGNESAEDVLKHQLSTYRAIVARMLEPSNLATFDNALKTRLAGKTSIESDHASPSPEKRLCLGLSEAGPGKNV